MLSLTSAEITQFIGTFWWPFCRLMGAFVMMPFLGHVHIPATVRILLAFMMAALLGPTLPPPPQVDPVSLAAVWLVTEQILIGFMLALFLTLMIHVMTLLGAMMSMQMGLAMALVNDPGSGSSEPILGQMFLMYGTLLFLALDGHLVAIGVVVDSFHLWPVGQGIFALPLMGLVERFAWMFGAAFMLALPAVLAMLVVNLTFGVLNRSAPSLNIFSLGFPMAMIMGLLCVLLSFSGLPTRYSDICLQALQSMYEFIGGTP
ncbi:flagellar biosynthetic protein FliR [Shewanella corallii]|uniref:Flagellar biosynthetic protein FliR n=2 Tax=Shewanella TaxID=22 RepID=A0ABT0NA95_9GAMM|nr:MULTISPECIES: flagellar biosynthetic protein FliR [Shewanella]MCL1038750.1 flagellar biosynthetic protein FliR [Shewanella submarina]MCL2915065.1 flagellar biosynthetic protein FliR [Shewanella corallii]